VCKDDRQGEDEDSEKEEKNEKDGEMRKGIKMIRRKKMQHAWLNETECTIFLERNIKEETYLEDLEIDKKTISKYII
jgi:hypothetical protein